MTTLIPFTCCIIFLSVDTNTPPRPPCSLCPTLPLSTLCVERHTPQPGYMQPLPGSISVSKTTSHTAASSVTVKRVFPAPFCPISPSKLLCACCWPWGGCSLILLCFPLKCLDCWSPGHCLGSGQIDPLIFCVHIF